MWFCSFHANSISSVVLCLPALALACFLVNPVTSVPQLIWIRDVRNHQSLNCQFLDTKKILISPSLILLSIWYSVFPLAALTRQICLLISTSCALKFSFTPETQGDLLYLLSPKWPLGGYPGFYWTGIWSKHFLLKLSSKESLGKSQHNNPNALPQSTSFLLQISKCLGEMVDLMSPWKYHNFWCEAWKEKM